MPDQLRQLAAMMFTDIFRYTGLMGEDELRFFHLLKKTADTKTDHSYRNVSAGFLVDAR